MIYSDWDMSSPGRRNMRSALLRADALFGTRTAYEWKTAEGIEKRSFSDLRADVEALGTAICGLGYEGAHIAICGANSYAWAVCYLAVLGGAGVAVPCAADEGAAGMEYLCSRGDVTLAFADDGAAEKLPAGVRTIKIGSQLPGLLERGRALVNDGDLCYTGLAIDDDSLCEILFTSGTTGEKRGVMLSNRNIMSIVCCDFPYLIGLRTLSTLPFSHGFEAVCHLLVSLMPGVTVCLSASPRRFAQDLVDFRCESAYIVPLQAEALLGPFAPLLAAAPALRVLVCGGAPLSEQVMAAYAARGVKLMNGYGLSECSPLVTLNTIERPGSCGRAADYCAVRIASPDAQGRGEIEVRGENVMSGYYRDPEETAAAFTPDGWLRTGDLGCLDSDGYLYITGRRKNLIVLKNGENIMPEELEAILARSLPREAQIRVSERDGALLAEGYGGDDPAAFYPLLRAAVEGLNASVSPAKRINLVEALASPLPKTALGKIKRR